MSKISSTTWLTSGNYLVSYYQGQWWVTEPNGCEWIWLSTCDIHYERNRLCDQVLIRYLGAAEDYWFDCMCLALAEAYYQSDQLAHLISQREIKGSPGTRQ